MTEPTFIDFLLEIDEKEGRNAYATGLLDGLLARCERDGGLHTLRVLKIVRRQFWQTQERFVDLSKNWDEKVAELEKMYRTTSDA